MPVRRAWWPLWGVLAGAGGILSNLVLNDQRHLSDAQLQSGAGVIEHLDRVDYQAGVVAGWVAIAGLLVTAAGWQRFAARRGDGHLAWRVATFGFVASAGALLLGYGVQGALAEYLPGGSNEDNFPAEGVYTMFVFNDNAPWVGWWGAMFAIAALAWLSFRRRGSIPLWLGILGALVVAHSTIVMVGVGAVAIAGATAPAWLVLASIWLLASPDAQRDAAAVPEADVEGVREP